MIYVFMHNQILVFLIKMDFFGYPLMFKKLITVLDQEGQTRNESNEKKRLFF